MQSQDFHGNLITVHCQVSNNGKLGTVRNENLLAAQVQLKAGIVESGQATMKDYRTVNNTVELGRTLIQFYLRTADWVVPGIFWTGLGC